jgi:SWI/SNF-related matrix-associated actin-dependent regulator of chromatin subfamily A3
MCRCELADLQSSTVEPMVIEDPTEAKDTEMDESSSSKIEAMIKILKASTAKTPGTKTVIFSQWTSFLNVFEPHLTKAGITFSRIDGGMKPQKRDEAIRRFGDDHECTVLLASLAIANVGLNLVMANQVIVAAPWWAPAIEQQACDRVYRLGQTRPVTVWKIVVANSIEERVIGIQEKKKQLVETVRSFAFFHIGPF